jgi:hypothetical protein
MPDIHLKYGGSTMARTIACKAWPQLSDKVKQLPQTNAAANHGSCLHECMETIVTGDNQPSDFLGQQFPEWDHTVTEEDVGLMVTAMEAFDQVADLYQCEEIEVEQFVQLTDNIGGSADVITAGPNHVLVVDWKFGYNEVSAHKSWQGATYALSALNTPHLEDMFLSKAVVAVIIQPKVSSEANIYEYEPDELGDMMTQMVAAVHEAENGHPEPHPGNHCQYCPASPTCPAKLIQANTAVNLPKDVSLDLETAMFLATELEPWIRSVKTFAHEMLEQGAELEGWKLVDKRATRQWGDPQAVTDKLKKSRKFKLEDYSDIKLKSAPQLEKVCKAKKVDFDKQFGDMVISRSSGTTLAPADDKRPAAKLGITQSDVQGALKKI